MAKLSADEYFLCRVVCISIITHLYDRNDVLCMTAALMSRSTHCYSNSYRHIMPAFHIPTAVFSRAELHFGEIYITMEQAILSLYMLPVQY